MQELVQPPRHTDALEELRVGRSFFCLWPTGHRFARVACAGAATMLRAITSRASRLLEVEEQEEQEEDGDEDGDPPVPVL